MGVMAFCDGLTPRVVGLNGDRERSLWGGLHVGGALDEVGPALSGSGVSRSRQDGLRGKQDGLEAVGRREVRIVPMKRAEPEEALVLVGVFMRLVGRHARLTRRERGYGAGFDLAEAGGRAPMVRVLVGLSQLIMADDRLAAFSP